MQSAQAVFWIMVNSLEIASYNAVTDRPSARRYEIGPNVPPTGFWPASPYQGSANGAWYVDINLGYSVKNDADSHSRVRCVR